MTDVAMPHTAGTGDRIVAKFFSGLDWTRTTKKFAPELRADIPADAAESPVVHEIDASRRALADQRIAARITALLGDADAIRARAKNVYVSVSGGIVTLFGAVRDTAASREIEHTVRTSTRIDGIQNIILTTGPRVGD